MLIPRWVRSTLWAAGLALLCGLTAAPLNALAQTTNGRFVVTVKDPTGAVISGATVTVENEGTMHPSPVRPAARAFIRRRCCRSAATASPSKRAASRNPFWRARLWASVRNTASS